MNKNTNERSDNVPNGFRDASLPLIKWLCENMHPHVTVIVTPTGAELLEGVQTTGEVLGYIKD